MRRPERNNATEPLRHELQIAAPPEVLFAYFTDPRRMVGSMGVGALLDRARRGCASTLTPRRRRRRIPHHLAHACPRSTARARLGRVTQPPRFADWFGGAEGEVPPSSVVMDVRIGGALRAVMRTSGRKISWHGEYLGVVEPDWLVFTLSTNRRRARGTPSSASRSQS
jgi:uncharacterized protein YndB with AHSA1/START domain